MCLINPQHYRKLYRASFLSGRCSAQIWTSPLHNRDFKIVFTNIKVSWPVNRRNSLPCSVMTSRQRLFNQGWIVCYVLKIISYSWPRVLYPLRVDDDLGYSRWLLDTSKKELWNNLFFHDLNTNTDMKLQIKFLMEANIYECHYKAVAYLKS